METDPNYEFEAPKWFDFTADFEDELNDSSLDSSWFEKVHPLHEPKDSSHHDATTKPLLTTTAQVGKTATSSRPQASKPKKNYNSKKSLGIKSIRTRRGQHEGLNNRESNGKVQQNRESSTANKDEKKKSQRNSSEEGRVTPREIKHNKHCSFTPPWTDSPHNRTDSTCTSHANKKEGRSSSLNNTAVFSPQRIPAYRSPLSPARVRSVKSSSESSSSPKTSLLSKAVSGTCQQANQHGRKRRLLPAIPDIKKNSPVGTCRSSSSPSHLHNQEKGKTEANNMNDQINTKQVACGVSNKPLRATDMSQVIEASTREHHHSNNTLLELQDKNNMFGQRPLEAIHENCTNKENPETVMQSNDTSLEVLLKQHNKKIAAAKNQYDENGRKIRTAEPNFCPAPLQKSVSSSAMLSSSTACKRPTASVEPVIAAKQKRRSCVAAVSNAQSEMSKSKTNSTSSNINRKGKDVVSKQTAKQKRRSCVAALQNSGHVNNTEKELRDLIAQHNSKVNAKRS